MLATYEKARQWSLANPKELQKLLVTATKLRDAVIEKQLGERTDQPRMASATRSILASRLAPTSASSGRPSVARNEPGRS